MHIVFLVFVARYFFGINSYQNTWLDQDSPLKTNLHLFLSFRPGTAILIVSSGLHAAFPTVISLVESFLINVAIVIYFVWVCLYKKQEKQLRVAQFLTFVYSMLMTVTIVGFMVKVCNIRDYRPIRYVSKFSPTVIGF